MWLLRHYQLGRGPFTARSPGGWARAGGGALLTCQGSPFPGTIHGSQANGSQANRAGGLSQQWLPQQRTGKQLGQAHKITQYLNTLSGYQGVGHKKDLNMTQFQLCFQGRDIWVKHTQQKWEIEKREIPPFITMILIEQFEPLKFRWNHHHNPITFCASLKSSYQVAFIIHFA